MARVTPYFGEEPRFPLRWIYHTNDQCRLGSTIPVEGRKKGQGGRRLCTVCNSMDVLEKNAATPFVARLFAE
jgi:hypothetical protein